MKTAVKKTNSKKIDILMIDNYDSFTFNLVQYLGILGEIIKVRRNDRITLDEIEEMGPVKIVISPGPGRPLRGTGLAQVHFRNLWGTYFLRTFSARPLRGGIRQLTSSVLPRCARPEAVRARMLGAFHGQSIVVSQVHFGCTINRTSPVTHAWRRRKSSVRR